MILDGNLSESIRGAVAALRSGQPIGLPTETVYGLAADASNSAAVAAVFAAKGRPANHPLIVHVADAAAVPHFAASVPEFAQRLIEAFWPGPLTVILPRRAGIADAAAGGHSTIGLRSPSHPVARAVLQACAQPTDGAAAVHGLAAPSANRFGRVSPTAAAHVEAELGSDLLVLDGGACTVGIESAIVDCSRGRPVLLRPGAITRAQIEAACGQPLLSPDEVDASDRAAPQAPGTLATHYAPVAKVRLMPAKALQTALDVLGPDAAHIAIYARTVLRTSSSQIVMRRMPEDAVAAAQQLFAALRGFDAQQVKLIWIEEPPASPDWDGVADRLRRAAAS